MGEKFLTSHNNQTVVNQESELKRLAEQNSIGHLNIVTTSATPRRKSVEKIELIYLVYLRTSRCSEFIQFVSLFLKLETECEIQRKVQNINIENYASRFTFSRQRRIYLFQVVGLQRTIKKCTKNYNARAPNLLLYVHVLIEFFAFIVDSLDLLFSKIQLNQLNDPDQICLKFAS